MSQATLATEALSLSWAESNRAYLEAELACLRLRLRRQVLWLRHAWQLDPLHGHPQVISDQQADRLLLVDDDGGAMRRFCDEDEEAAAAGQALRRAEERSTGLLAAMDRASTPPALALLARLFGLSAFEGQVLLLCLAPELDPGFADLYAYVQDHAGRRYPTPHLALRLLAPDAELQFAARNSFLPAAPLRRYALVELEPGPMPAAVPSSQPLRLPERVADYMRGVDRPDEQVTDLLRLARPGLLAPSQQALVAKLAAWMEAGPHGPPLANLLGPAGSGRQALAQALCARAGLQLAQLDLGHVPPGPQLHRLLQVLAREAALSGLAYYLDLTRLEPAQEPLARAVVERLEGTLLIASEERWPVERNVMVVAVPRPSAAEQRRLWQRALDGIPHQVDEQLGTLVQQFDLGPPAIVRAVAAARNLALLRAPEDGAAITAADLWQACREQSSPRLEQLAQRIVPVYVWDDIVLPGDLLGQLRELAAQVAHRHQVYETWGFGARLSRGRGISALFAGPSGTGKTMAAEILANALQLDLYRIDLAGVVNKYIGETEKNLKQVFDAAEQSGAILFFDEADALFGKRTEVKDSHDRYANIEVNYLLQRMEDYRGLAILATNRKSALDRAFLRRLRFLLDFPFPDAADRRRIWRKVFPPQTPLAGIDYGALARLEIPGGNIHNIALNAAFLAADEGVAVGMEHIMHAARREYGKIDKMMSAIEFGDYYGEVAR
jgi:hypothetical protein